MDTQLDTASAMGTIEVLAWGTALGLVPVAFVHGTAHLISWASVEAGLSAVVVFLALVFFLGRGGWLRKVVGRSLR